MSSSSSPQLRIIDLPDEILLKIFENLKSSRKNYYINEKITLVFNKSNLLVDSDLINLSQACSKFRHLTIGYLYRFVSFFRMEEDDSVRQCKSYCLKWNERIQNGKKNYWNGSFEEIFSNVGCLEISIGQLIRIWEHCFIDKKKQKLTFGENLDGLKVFSIESEKEINEELIKIVNTKGANLKFWQNLKLRNLLISINGINSELIYKFIMNCGFLNSEEQFADLKRLDILIDCETEYFKEILTIFTKKLENNCKWLTEMNLISKNFKMIMLQDEINEFLINVGKNLQVLSFRNSKNKISHRYNNKVNANKGINTIDFGRFGKTMSYELKCLKHIIIEISILENFKTPAIKKLHKGNFKINNLEKIDLTIDLVEGSSYDFTNFVNKSPDSLYNFLTYFSQNDDEIYIGNQQLPIQQNIKIVLNFVRQLESISFKHEIVLMKNLITTLMNSNPNHNETNSECYFNVKAVVFNWAWSMGDQSIIHNYNSQIMNENKNNKDRRNALKLKVPSYSRLGFCSPYFRQIETFKVVKKKEGEQEIEFERIDVCEDDIAENEEFWSFETCKADLQKYSEPLRESSIWD